MDKNRFDFKKIEFGLTDAQSEGRRYPSLLTKGYLDLMHVVEKALSPGKFLFLGYKGSGKSALSAHLYLTNKDRRKNIIHEIMMKAFPYKLFGKIVKGEAEPEAKYPLAWRWILLMYVLYSFDLDNTVNGIDPFEWNETVKELQKSHLFPITTISDLVSKTSKRTFKINLKFVEYETETAYNTQGIDVNLLVNHLQRLLSNIKSDNNHYLIIDGLDDFLSARDSQNNSITSLINESKDLNNWFIENGINFKIIVLCRKDVFDRLSDPNKNKIRQDYSFFINWFDESETDDYSQSNLIKLANIRGNLTFSDIGDIFSRFFPSSYDSKPIYQALLEYKRHTPRDFLCLLKHIQESCRGTKVTDRDIQSGIKSYSSEYFVGEIRDEMAGYVKPQDIELTFSLMSDFRKRDFKLSDIQTYTSQKDAYSELDLSRIFSVLFECSAIGHMRDNRHYIKYRNPHMTFSANETIILHKGLWKGL